jgi:hypothetical protein
MGELIELNAVESSSVKIDVDAATIRCGQWYWVKGSEGPWLACVTQIGSNYVLLEHPNGGYARLHADELGEHLTFEPKAEQIIQETTMGHQRESQRLLREIQAITERLGFSGTVSLQGPMEQSGNALVVLSGTPDLKGYQSELTVLKETTLPDLFKELKESNKELADWMKAPLLALKHQQMDLREIVDHINGRIFNVSLYAGLVEEATKCRDGAPADMFDKLHVMQRRLYMDEECLVNYQAGGMEFNDIGEFDAWLTQPDNFTRLLPFPRTLVAFRVRHYTKDRGPGFTALEAHIRLQMEEADKWTFLYVRNGEQLWRINTEIELEELIFPDSTVFDLHEPKMAKMFGSRVDRMMSTADYETRKVAYDANVAAYDAWKKEHEGDEDAWYKNPFRHYDTSFRPDDWSPVDPSNVYYDECMAYVKSKLDYYNRVALIIQGLFDRSVMLHPHPPVKSWSADGFERAIKLVYDGQQVLAAGEAPDFEVYRRECNVSLSASSIVTGQYDYWYAQQRQKFERSEKRYFHVDRHRAPPKIGPMQQWARRSRKATFIWEVDKSGYRGGMKNTRMVVPDSHLFNVSAYKPGDFKQFYQDIRTREQYMQWAPLLLRAEDYWATKK